MAQLFIQMSYTIGILLGALIFLQALPRPEYFAPRITAVLVVIVLICTGISRLSRLALPRTFFVKKRRYPQKLGGIGVFFV